MHENSKRLMAKMLHEYAPAEGNGRLVYDVGSYDVNGNYRDLCERRGWKYVGIDITAGPNVDVVVRNDAGRWYDRGVMHNRNQTVYEQADLVISGSTMEHVRMPWVWIEQVKSIMKPDSRFLMHTHASWPLHRHPVDCWRILPDGAKALAEWANMKLVDTMLSSVEGHGVDIWAVFEKPLD